jgi:hypothetical protein
MAEAAVVDDARYAAEGTRSAARWITTAFAGLPVAALVAALITGPGEAGYRPWLLGLGISFLAVGVLIGVLAFARVFAPVAVSDAQLTNDSAALDGVVGVPPGIDNYAGLTAAIANARAEFTDKAAASERCTNLAATSEAAAKAAEAEAARSEEQADAAKTPEATQRAQTARGRATQRREEADDAARGAALAKADKADAERQLERTLGLRAQAFHLSASREIGSRFFDARCWAIPAVAAVALGLGLLANAQASEPTPTSVLPTLVTIDLTPVGAEKLGCRNADELRALRLGGTDAAPTLITLSRGGCPERYVTLPTGGKTPWGSVTAVEQIKEDNK